MAKSRVAPLKNKLEIPKLELQGAVLAARMANTIVSSSTLQFEKIRIFSDSMIVLTWIKNESKHYGAFVAARTNEINMKTKADDWAYCKTELNAADHITRGLRMHALKERFHQSPDFLKKAENEWPASSPQLSEEQKKLESQINTGMVAAVTRAQKRAANNTPFEQILKNVSNFRKVVRITAFVFRAINNFKSKGKTYKQLHKGKIQERVGPLQPEEEIYAERRLALMAQNGFSSDVMKQYQNLSPFLDKTTGLYKVGGRVSNSLVTYNQKHPILLPRDHGFSKLVIQRAHQYGHWGVARTVAKSREKYWIIGAERLAKSAKYKCVTCRELSANVETQVMADLPAERMTPSNPFRFTSVDLFGPCQVKISRNRTAKHYGVVFTCMTTRAVYIDVAHDASTNAFLLVLKRFTSIRGQPETIISDNGSNLVGADREIRDTIEGWDQKALEDYSERNRIKWKFVTPRAAHMNGVTEALVKSIKRSLKKVIGKQKMTLPELQTIMFEVADIINSRPIGRIPNDPDDGKCLTPNDLLIGRSSSENPQGIFTDKGNPHIRHEFIQRVVKSWWDTWYRDVFPTLMPRKKWHINKRNVQVGDLVLLKDPSPLICKYNKGVVVQVFPGQDGKVRNLSIRTANGKEYQRHVTKVVVICPVDGWGNDEDE
jgi:hypothetical protein